MGRNTCQALATFGEEGAGAARVTVTGVMECHGELDETLQTLAPRVRLRAPDGFENLVHLEEEAGVPERHGLVECAIERRALAPCAVGSHGAEPGPRVRADGVGMRGVDREQLRAARVDEVRVREPCRDAWSRR